jgi:hypothetical protein
MIGLKTYTSCPQYGYIKHMKSSYLSSVTVRELGQTKDKHMMVEFLALPSQMWQDPEYYLCLQSLPSQHDLQHLAPVITIAKHSICHCLSPAVCSVSLLHIITNNDLLISHVQWHPQIQPTTTAAHLEYQVCSKCIRTDHSTWSR